MITNLYLKFSELVVLDKKSRPFSDTFGATSSAIITEFLSLDEIIYMPLEELVAYINKKGRYHFTDPYDTAKVLAKAARDSYRLDKTLYEPINASIASSFNIIQAFQGEIKLVDKAIIKAVRGLNLNSYQVLLSIPGFGPVYAGGILSEIGDIHVFHSDDALAKYAGITWRTKQSGPYQADITRMTKTGNKYLRYYLIEAANSIRKKNPEYKSYYKRKYNETHTHQHKRALALTSRKLVRLVFSLLKNDQLYSSDHTGNAADE
jgi:transposase